MRAILGLGESLGLKVLAEGIEHADDAAYLKLMGCQEGQGFHFGKAAPNPVPAEMPARQRMIG